MKRALDYIKYSHIEVALHLNPFGWIRNPFYMRWHGPTDMDPGAYVFSIKILPLKVVIILDDGSW